MISLFANKQFMAFIITGGFAASVNFLSRIGFNHFFSYSTAIILAYICGMITAFILAKLFVFQKSGQSTGKSILLFCIVNFFAVLQTWAVSMTLAYQALPLLGIENYRAEIAHAIGVMVPVFTSYLGHKHFSFRE